MSKAAKEDIVLIGGGGHCKACIDVIEEEGKFNIAGIVDIKEKIGQKILGYEIIACDDDIPELTKKYKNFIITLGQIKSSDLRRKLFDILSKYKVYLPSIISPIAYVSKTAKIGEGSIVMHHALINSNAIVGKNCIINTKALIEHDAIIGNHCHISTTAVVNGGAEIGEGTFYGSGAVCKENIKIPAYSFIKANSIVK